MTEPLIPQEDYLRNVLDAIPSMVVVMDRKLRILDANRAALEGLGGGEPMFLRQMCGEILRCAKLVTPEDQCGETEECPDCRIREATELSVAGITVVRKHHRMEIRGDSGPPREIHFLVSSNEFMYYGKIFVMIVLEDVTELMQLRTVVPVCRHCNRIRTGQDVWETLDQYLENHKDRRETEVCPVCRGRREE